MTKRRSALNTQEEIKRIRLEDQSIDEEDAVDLASPEFVNGNDF